LPDFPSVVGRNRVTVSSPINTAYRECTVSFNVQFLSPCLIRFSVPTSQTRTSKPFLNTSPRPPGTDRQPWRFAKNFGFGGKHQASSISILSGRFQRRGIRSELFLRINALRSVRRGTAGLKKRMRFSRVSTPALPLLFLPDTRTSHWSPAMMSPSEKTYRDEFILPDNRSIGATGVASERQGESHSA